VLEGHHSLFATDAGGLHPAERGLDVNAGRRVDGEHPGFHRPGDPEGTTNVPGPDRARQTVDAVIGETDRLVLTIDGKDRLYFTDLAGAAVYRVDGPGKVERILAAPQVERPNGIQVSPDDRTLYLVEANSAQGGARMIRAYDLLPDGSVGNMRVHYNFSPGRSADGMSIDTKGNLWASAGLNSLRGTAETLDTKAGVHVISPEGKLLRFIPIPEDLITNNAFGGEDMRTLYVTAGKTLYKIRSDVPGMPR